MRKDLTTGSVTGNILHLAWPMMIAFLLEMGFNLVDTIFIGHYSADALAAISMTFPVVFLIIAVGSGMGIGVTSYIARLIGASKIAQAKVVTKHALLLAFFLWIFLCILGLTLAKPLFQFIGGEGDILSMAVTYTNTIFIGSLFLFFTFLSTSILRGEGDTKTPMIIMGISAILNIIFDPFLIFGIWIFPELGIFGAAIATVAARIIGTFAVLYYLFNGKAILKLDLKPFKIDLKVYRKIFSVGIPASLSHSVISFGMFFMLKIVSLFGPMAIAAYGVVGRLEMMSFIFAIGIAMAVVTIVGQNVGAKNCDRAEKTAWIAAILTFVLMGAIGFIYFIMPGFFISIFNQDPKIIKYGSSYLRIVGPFYGFIGIEVIISSAFQGAGKGFPSLTLQTLRLFIISVPLGYILSRWFGVNGIWTAISVSILVTSIVSAIWFRAGTWKKGKTVCVPEEATAGVGS
jgi:MATE family, multidrug efflux pump